MSKKEEATREGRNRQVQLVQKDSLVNALKIKAGAQHISMNEAANKAIAEYLKNGGENLHEERNRRIMLLIPQSMHDSLKELSKAQNISMNQCVDHALTAYVTGNKIDNTTGNLIYYISETGKLRATLSTVMQTINQGHGGVRACLERITSLKEKKIPKSKEPERQKQILVEVDRIKKTVDEMVEKANKVWRNED